jgi:transcriptional regulator GlxA family with amidase domain
LALRAAAAQQAAQQCRTAAAALEEDWPVERLANVSRVCDAHFAGAFKEAFGVPPHRYLLTRRIEWAKALLRDSDALIIEMAF